MAIKKTTTVKKPAVKKDTKPTVKKPVATKKPVAKKVITQSVKEAVNKVAEALNDMKKNPLKGIKPADKKSCCPIELKSKVEKEYISTIATLTKLRNDLLEIDGTSKDYPGAVAYFIAFADLQTKLVQAYEGFYKFKKECK